MNTICKAIENAKTEYEDVADRFERGEAGRRELIHAERKLNGLRAEADLERWLTQADNRNYVPAIGG